MSFGPTFSSDLKIEKNITYKRSILSNNNQGIIGELSVFTGRDRFMSSSNLNKRVKSNVVLLSDPKRAQLLMEIEFLSMYLSEGTIVIYPNKQSEIEKFFPKVTFLCPKQLTSMIAQRYRIEHPKCLWITSKVEFKETLLSILDPIATLLCTDRAPKELGVIYVAPWSDPTHHECYIHILNVNKIVSPLNHNSPDLNVVLDFNPAIRTQTFYCPELNKALTYDEAAENYILNQMDS